MGFHIIRVSQKGPPELLAHAEATQVLLLRHLAGDAGGVALDPNLNPSAFKLGRTCATEHLFLLFVFCPFVVDLEM